MPAKGSKQKQTPQRTNLPTKRSDPRNIQHKQIKNAMQKLHLQVNVMMLEIAYFQVKILQTKQ